MHLVLEDADYSLMKYINTIDEISNFKIVRYQDDMYILFDTKKRYDNQTLSRICNNIQGMYATELSNLGLTLNMDKVAFGKSDEICLTKIGPWYDDTFPSFEEDLHPTDYHKLFHEFISKLYEQETLNHSIYKQIIEDQFQNKIPEGVISKIEHSSTENYNHFTYNFKLTNDESERIYKLIEKHNNIVFVDSKRFFTFADKTKEHIVMKYSNC